MEPWLYELDIRYNVLPIKKCIQDNKTMYLLKIEDYFFVYSQTEYKKSGMITYSLIPGSFMPEHYRVELSDDDCPDLNIVISLYLCYLQCSLQSISITSTTPEYAEMEKRTETITESILGEPLEKELTTFTKYGAMLKDLEENNKDLFSMFDGNIEKQKNEEPKTDTNSFKFDSLDMEDLDDIWNEKPSWQK